MQHLHANTQSENVGNLSNSTIDQYSHVPRGNSLTSSQSGAEFDDEITLPYTRNARLANGGWCWWCGRGLNCADWDWLCLMIGIQTKWCGGHLCATRCICIIPAPTPNSRASLWAIDTMFFVRLCVGRCAEVSSVPKVKPVWHAKYKSKVGFG